jgi:hypothetical protein
MPSDLAASFTRETRKALHLFGVWPPGDVIELGAFGALDGDLFRPLGHITRTFNVRLSKRNAGPKLQLEFKSAGTREIRGSANASVESGVNPAEGKVTTKLMFGYGGSTYFRAKDATYSAVENLADVNEAIMAAYEADRWPGHYAFVHGVFHATSTTIIISSEDHAEIQLQGKASAGGLLDSADAGAEIASKDERDIAFQVLAKPGFTPLICLSQIRPRNRLLS